MIPGSRLSLLALGWEWLLGCLLAIFAGLIVHEALHYLVAAFLGRAPRVVIGAPPLRWHFWDYRLAVTYDAAADDHAAIRAVGLAPLATSLVLASATYLTVGFLVEHGPWWIFLAALGPVSTSAEDVSVIRALGRGSFFDEPLAVTQLLGAVGVFAVGLLVNRLPSLVSLEPWATTMANMSGLGLLTASFALLAFSIRNSRDIPAEHLLQRPVSDLLKFISYR